MHAAAVLKYVKPLSMRPPLHPWLPSALLQSTNCCSERDTNLPVAISHAPSSEPVVLKALRRRGLEPCSASKTFVYTVNLPSASCFRFNKSFATDKLSRIKHSSAL